MSDNRNQRDFYPTPPLVAEAGVEWALRTGLCPHPGQKAFIVLEPGAGDTEPFLTAFASLRLSNNDFKRRLWGMAVQYCAVDPYVDCLPPQYRKDYLAWTPKSWRGAPHLIITNPPFSLAEQFVRHSLEVVHPLGLVVMLLRSTFEGSKARRSFWHEHPPFQRLVLRPRPSFTNGGSDSSEYAFYFWAALPLRAFMRRHGVTRCDTGWIDSPTEKGWKQDES